MKNWMIVAAMMLPVVTTGFGCINKDPAANPGGQSPDEGTDDDDSTGTCNDYSICDEVVAFHLRTPCDQVEDKETWYVKKDGTGDFTVIQDAIDAASHCDTIIVGPGVYHEGLHIQNKDLVIQSDVYDEQGVLDGDEEIEHEAHFLDLVTYWDTGALLYTETVTAQSKVLRRTTRTVLDGSQLGTNVAIVDFLPGISRDSVLDGFTIEFLPETDHTEPGHVHTLNAMGASPEIVNNLFRYNGSTAIGGHATFNSVHSRHEELDDYRASAIQFRPAVLAINNIVYCNNGVGIGANHYSCMEVYENEVFWSHMPREYKESPGIGSKHGAKTRIERNIVYDNAWVGIGCRQGKLEGEPGKHVNERTLSMVRDNLVWDNGWPEAPETHQGNIGVDGCGLPENPVQVEGNVVWGAGASGIGIRNEFSGLDYVCESTHVIVVDNEVFENTTSGIGCNGNTIGPAECEIQANIVHDNGMAGILVGDGAVAEVFDNVLSENGTAGIKLEGSSDGLVHHNECLLNSTSGILFDTGATGQIYHNVADRNGTAGIHIEGTIPVVDNIVRRNATAGIYDPDCSNCSYNILSGNNGQPDDCGESPEPWCTNPQTTGCGVLEGSLFRDPGFTDPDNLDYHLLPDSPAIDAGLDLGLFPFTGYGPDMGRFECY